MAPNTSKTPTTSNPGNLASDLANWMTNLPETLKKVPIIYLAIPGSHDSGTYCVTRHSKLAPDAEKWMLKLKFGGLILRGIMCHWSKCQKYRVNEQLMAGIRYFDLRTASKPNDDLHLVHALYAGSVLKFLEEMVQFLYQHPKEIVIVDFQHFYAMHVSDHNYLMSCIQQIFGDKIVPFTYNLTQLTLEYFHDNNYQVLIIYRLPGNHPYYTWRYFPTPWPNAPTTAKLIIKLNEILAKRNNNFGHITQFILTPDAKAIIKNLCGSSRTYSAKPMYKKHIQWLQSQKPGAGGINIVIGDYINIKEHIFPETVINLNLKLLEG